jgi:hypothetical protein
VRRRLNLHPESRCEALERIEAQASRPGPQVLVLRFVLTGEIGQLVLPSRSAPERADELWRRTCLEAFVGGRTGESYLELNFAPSSRWAAYRFDGYRQGMAPAAIGAPTIEAGVQAGRFELDVRVDLAGLAPDGAWRLGLSAVIEQSDGSISYWALRHPPGRPDFHHRDCFAGQLLAPRRP